MFVCLRKDAKQCGDTAKLDCTHCAGQRPLVIDQHIEYSRALRHHNITGHLFGDKHQNLATLRQPINTKYWEVDIKCIKIQDSTQVDYQKLDYKI